MKKLTVLVVTLAALTNAAFAQETSQNQKSQPMYGKQKQMDKEKKSDSFAWGIGLGALAVIGVVVGVTAGSAAGN